MGAPDRTGLTSTNTTAAPFCSEEAQACEDPGMSVVPDGVSGPGETAADSTAGSSEADPSTSAAPDQYDAATRPILDVGESSGPLPTAARLYTPDFSNRQTMVDEVAPRLDQVQSLLEAGDLKGATAILAEAEEFFGHYAASHPKEPARGEVGRLRALLHLYRGELTARTEGDDGVESAAHSTLEGFQILDRLLEQDPENDELFELRDKARARLGVLRDRAGEIAWASVRRETTDMALSGFLTPDSVPPELRPYVSFSSNPDSEQEAIFTPAFEELPRPQQLAVAKRLQDSGLVGMNRQALRRETDPTRRLFYETKVALLEGRLDDAKRLSIQFCAATRGTKDPELAVMREEVRGYVRNFTLETIERLRGDADTLLEQREENLGPAGGDRYRHADTLAFLDFAAGLVESGRADTLQEAEAAIAGELVRQRERFGREHVVGKGSTFVLPQTKRPPYGSPAWKEERKRAAAFLSTFERNPTTSSTRGVPTFRLEGGVLEVPPGEIGPATRIVIGKEGGQLRLGEFTYTFPPADRERVVALADHTLRPGVLKSGKDFRQNPHLGAPPAGQLAGWSRVREEDPQVAALLSLEDPATLDRMATRDGHRRELLATADTLRARNGSYVLAAQIYTDLFSDPLRKAMDSIPEAEVRQIQQTAKGSEAAARELRKRAFARIDSWYESGRLDDDPIAKAAWQNFEAMQDPLDKWCTVSDRSADRIIDEVVITAVTMPIAMGAGSAIRVGLKGTSLAIRVLGQAGRAGRAARFAMRAGIWATSVAGEATTMEGIGSVLGGRDFELRNVGMNMLSLSAFHGGGALWGRAAQRLGVSETAIRASAGAARLAREGANFAGTMATQTSVATGLAYAEAALAGHEGPESFWMKMGEEGLRMVAFHYGTKAINAATGNLPQRAEQAAERRIGVAQHLYRQARREVYREARRSGATPDAARTQAERAAGARMPAIEAAARAAVPPVLQGRPPAPPSTPPTDSAEAPAPPPPEATPSSTPTPVTPPPVASARPVQPPGEARFVPVAQVRAKADKTAVAPTPERIERYRQHLLRKGVSADEAAREAQEWAARTVARAKANQAGRTVIADTNLPDVEAYRYLNDSTVDHHGRFLTPDGKNSTMKLLDRMEAALAKHGGDVEAATAELNLRVVTTDNLGDGGWCVWIAKNQQRVLADPALRALIREATHFEDFTAFGTEYRRGDPAVELQAAIFQRYNEILTRHKIMGRDALAQARPDADPAAKAAANAEAEAMIGEAMAAIDEMVGHPAARAAAAEGFWRGVDEAAGLLNGTARMAGPTVDGQVVFYDLSKISQFPTFTQWLAVPRAHALGLQVTVSPMPPRGTNGTAVPQSFMLVAIPNGRSLPTGRRLRPTDPSRTAEDTVVAALNRAEQAKAAHLGLTPTEWTGKDNVLLPIIQKGGTILTPEEVSVLLRDPATGLFEPAAPARPQPAAVPEPATDARSAVAPEPVSATARLQELQELLNSLGIRMTVTGREGGDVPTVWIDVDIPEFAEAMTARLRAEEARGGVQVTGNHDLPAAATGGPAAAGGVLAGAVIAGGGLVGKEISLLIGGRPARVVVNVNPSPEAIRRQEAVRAEVERGQREARAVRRQAFDGVLREAGARLEPDERRALHARFEEGTITLEDVRRVAGSRMTPAQVKRYESLLGLRRPEWLVALATDPAGFKGRWHQVHDTWMTLQRLTRNAANDHPKDAVLERDLAELEASGVAIGSDSRASLDQAFDIATEAANRGILVDPNSTQLKGQLTYDQLADILSALYLSGSAPSTDALAVGRPDNPLTTTADRRIATVQFLKGLLEGEVGGTARVEVAQPLLPETFRRDVMAGFRREVPVAPPPPAVETPRPPEEAVAVAPARVEGFPPAAGEVLDRIRSRPAWQVRSLMPQRRFEDMALVQTSAHESGHLRRLCEERGPSGRRTELAENLSKLLQQMAPGSGGNGAAPEIAWHWLKALAARTGTPEGAAHFEQVVNESLNLYEMAVRRGVRLDGSVVETVATATPGVIDPIYAEAARMPGARPADITPAGKLRGSQAELAVVKYLIQISQPRIESVRVISRSASGNGSTPDLMVTYQGAGGHTTEVWDVKTSLGDHSGVDIEQFRRFATGDQMPDRFRVIMIGGRPPAQAVVRDMRLGAPISTHHIPDMRARPYDLMMGISLGQSAGGRR